MEAESTTTAETTPAHKSNTLKYVLIAVGVVVILLLFAAIVAGGIYVYTHRNKTPTTTLATSAGTVPDGTNSILTYTSTGSTLGAVPSSTGCAQLFNSNYVGYKFVNNNTASQTLSILGYAPGNTHCGATMMYNSPTIPANTTVWWENNLVNHTAFSLYYNCLIKLTNNQNLGFEYYVVGNPTSTAGTIDNSKQYLLITATGNKTTIQVVNN